MFLRRHMFFVFIMSLIIYGFNILGTAAQQPTTDLGSSGERLHILDFNTLSPTTLRTNWRAIFSTDGAVAYNIDPTRSLLPDEGESLRVYTDIPCGQPTDDNRYVHLQRVYDAAQDFSGYQSINIDVFKEEDTYNELTLVLVEEDEEEWHSTRLMRGNGQWQHFSIGLNQGSSAPADSWAHEDDFVIPTWFSGVVDNTLDLSKIREVRIRTMTTVGAACDGDEVTEVWIGSLYVSTSEPVLPQGVELPNIDLFNYADTQEMQNAWTVATTGEVTLSLDVGNGAAAPSMLVNVNLPCDNPGRYMLVSRRFEEVVDLSPYTEISFLVHNVVPEMVGGAEFSVLLWDKGETREEVWQSTRWIPGDTDDSSWQAVVIKLEGNIERDDPWAHPENFTIPSWDDEGDGELDLTQIIAIGFKSNTTNENCQISQINEIWIDNIRVR